MSSAARPLRITPRAVTATLLVFVAAGLCVRLGFWQLDRLAQRRERNEELRTRLEAPPVKLSHAPRDSAGWLQRRVVVEGTFDNDRSIILPGRLFQGAPGAHVVTPVLLEDGSVVLADRGWVSAADGATVDLTALQLGSRAADAALVLPFPGQERHLGRSPDKMPASIDSQFRRVWFAIDARALRAQFPYRLGAVHVRLLPSAAAPAVPLRAPMASLGDGPHLGYAIQWFSFAIIAIVGWIVIYVHSTGFAKPAPDPEPRARNPHHPL